METPIFFIIHDDDSSIKTYKLKIIDKCKCSIMLTKYSEISCSDKKEEIVEYATGLVNIFFGSKDEWHQELIQKHVTIDFSNDIGHLKQVNNNKINYINPSRIYFVEFHER